MSIELQIKSLIAFFIYGIIFYIIGKTSRNIILKYVITILETVIFIIVLYNTNNGIIHPYFILSFILGIILSKESVKLIKTKIILLKSKKYK